LLFFPRLILTKTYLIIVLIWPYEGNDFSIIYGFEIVRIGGVFYFEWRNNVLGVIDKTFFSSSTFWLKNVPVILCLRSESRTLMDVFDLICVTVRTFVRKKSTKTRINKSNSIETLEDKRKKTNPSCTQYIYISTMNRNIYWIRHVIL